MLPFSRNPLKYSLIIAGGGTGGHIWAGVAIADEWKKQNLGPVLFVGSSGGLEERLVPKAGYPLVLLQMSALKRMGILKQLASFSKIPLSLIKSIVLLLRFRPKAVIGVGGYASGPVVLVASCFGWMWGCKTAILEQNAVTGLTNRILGTFVHTVFVAFSGLEKQFSGKRVVVTGNPIRSQLVAQPLRARDPFTLFVFGGSQGAVGVNNLVLSAIDELKKRPNLFKFKIVHQAGVKDFDRVVQCYRDLGYSVPSNEIKVERFIDDMNAAYAEAHLLICRAGASTLSEVAAVKRPAIFIPLPTAADNHQEMNATNWVKQRAAWIISQNRATGKDLADKIIEAFENPQLLESMAEAASQFYRPDAAYGIVKILKA